MHPFAFIVSVSGLSLLLAVEGPSTKADRSDDAAAHFKQGETLRQSRDDLRRRRPEFERRRDGV